VKCVIASSFARIHRKNLINFGILPIELEIEANVSDLISVKFDNENIKVTNVTKNIVYNLTCNLSKEEYDLIVAGGLLNTL
jgi:aconitate hydratase